MLSFPTNVNDMSHIWKRQINNTCYTYFPVSISPNITKYLRLSDRELLPNSEKLSTALNDHRIHLSRISPIHFGISPLKVYCLSFSVNNLIYYSHPQDPVDLQLSRLSKTFLLDLEIFFIALLVASGVLIWIIPKLKFMIVSET